MMEDNEKAKFLLLGYSCLNCEYHNVKITSAAELAETKELQKYMPNNIIISLECRFDNKIIPTEDYREYVCINHKFKHNSINEDK